ncbi:outer membrane protein assembly factor BamB family protein [Archaeoglobus fulgidus]|uniref:outer membrane protein assembly factor BamB family protein n=1 Tax=Archaeoglobus fulgidus TaxID=2234 RepID=UPI000B363C6E|nr:PQQ-binding-like beta-propeller repeat protein [Archaeoglobus fulgidus]
MRKFALISLTLIMLTAAASATTFHGDVQRTGNFTASGEIIPHLAWKTQLTGLVGASPVYYNGHIYVTNWFGWGDWQPGLYSLNATTGSVEWRNATISGASSVAVFGNLLVVGDITGMLYYVDAASGDIVKAVKLESSPLWWGIASSPLVYNGSVYVTTFSNGTLWKIDSDGNVVWRYTTGGEIDPYTSPSAFKGLVFFAGNESGNALLVAVNESGVEQWKFPVDGKITNSPSTDGQRVYVATETKLYAVNLDGTEAWSVAFSGTMSTAAVAYGNVYIGSDGKLYCFNASDGTKKWETAVNGKIDSSPAVAGGVVYFATNTPEGTLYAVDALSGEVLWYYRLSPPSGSYYNIMSSPFIAENKLFIGADSGYVYCFETSGSFEFNVTLIPGKFEVLVNGNSYEVNRTTALGALYESENHTVNGAKVWFEVSLDDSWYSQYGFFIKTIMGLGTDQIDGNWIYWSVWNETGQISVGADRYNLNQKETVYYCYGDGSSLNSCLILLKINADVKPAGISSLELSNGNRGGNITAWVNVTSASTDWYVVVVSGVGEQGEAIAGISTFRLNAGEELRVPVLIHIPQLADQGTYSLYAGVYRFSEYPANLIHLYGPASCEVS